MPDLFLMAYCHSPQISLIFLSGWAHVDAGSTFQSTLYFLVKNSDIGGAVAAAPGGFCNPRESMMVRSMLWCW